MNEIIEKMTNETRGFITLVYELVLQDNYNNITNHNFIVIYDLKLYNFVYILDGDIYKENELIEFFNNSTDSEYFNIVLNNIKESLYNKD